MAHRAWFLSAAAWLLVVSSLNIGECRKSEARKQSPTNASLDSLDDQVNKSSFADEYNFHVGDDAKCVNIPTNMSLCYGIGYTQMRLPNLLHHQTLGEVTQQASSWSPLIATRCHSDAQVFLCSLFSPVCLDQLIWPCRSLCEQVKASCEPRMLVHGFPWPKMLNCDNFPSNDDLCIDPQHNVQTRVNATQGISTCPACQHVKSVSLLAYIEDLRARFCAADFAAKVRIDETVLSGSDLRITTKKKGTFYKHPDASLQKKKRQTFYLDSAASCDCPDLESFKTTGSNEQYIMMGRLDQNKRLAVTYLHKYDPAATAFRKAMRVVFANDQCKSAENSTVTPNVDVKGKKKKSRRMKKAERLEKKEEKKFKKMKQREKKRLGMKAKTGDVKLNDKKKTVQGNKKINGNKKQKRLQTNEDVQGREQKVSKEAKKRRRQNNDMKMTN